MRIEKLLKLLKHEFIKVNLLQASLDALIFFLTINLMLFLFSIQLIPGYDDLKVLALISVLFLVIDLAYRSKSYNLEIYERKNPELEERLRTARDNLDKRNIVSQALFDELLERARKVTSESIIPNKKIIQKILAVGILSFFTVISGMVGFQIHEEGGDLLPELDGFERILDDGEDEDFEIRNTTDIYGDEDDVDLADLEMEFNITGEGESGDRDVLGGQDTEDLTLDVTGDPVDADLDLAREYSLAIRSME